MLVLVRHGAALGGLRTDILRGLLIAPGNVFLQKARLNPPLAPAPDLDRRQLAGPHQGIGLG